MAISSRHGVTSDGSLWTTPDGNTYLTRFEAETEAFFECNPDAGAKRAEALGSRPNVPTHPPQLPPDAYLDPFSPSSAGAPLRIFRPLEVVTPKPISLAQFPPVDALFMDMNIERTVRNTGDPPYLFQEVLPSYLDTIRPSGIYGLGPDAGPAGERLFSEMLDQALEAADAQAVREAHAYQEMQIDNAPAWRVNAEVATYPNEPPTPIGYTPTEKNQNYLDAYRAATILAEETAIPPGRMKKKYFAVRFKRGALQIVSGAFSDEDLRPGGYPSKTVWLDGEDVPVAELCDSEDRARARAWVQLMGPALPVPPSMRSSDRPDGSPCLTSEEHAGYVRAWKREVQAQLRAELRPGVLAEMQRELGLAEASRVRVETLQQEYHGTLAVKKQLEENEQTHARQLTRIARERALAMSETTLPTPVQAGGSVASAAAPMLSALTNAVKSRASDAVDSVKADGKKALLRTTCRQGVRIAREGILSMMKKHKAPKAAAGLAERVLSTRAGEGLLGWGLGVVIERVPMLSQYPAAKLVAEELRVEGMSVGSDTLAEVAREYLIPNLGPLFEMFTQASAQMDREPAALPATPLSVGAPPQTASETSHATSHAT